MMRRCERRLQSLFFGNVNIPPIKNERMDDYAPGAPETLKLIDTLAKMRSQPVPEIPVVIHGKEYRPGPKQTREIPSDHRKPMAYYYNADADLAKLAVESSLEAAKEWSRTSTMDRLKVILKAATLLSGPYRHEVLAATMLGQSKNVWQGEIDAVAEACDFFRYNSLFAQDLYKEQPLSPASSAVWNAVDYRPLEGFVLAISPFNFTAIAANLASAPAMLGNTVVWKPSPSAIYSNYLLYQILTEAGLPHGVLNFLPANADVINQCVTPHRALAGVAFTGSTQVFSSIWAEVAKHLPTYRAYPRLSGETGGKNFHLVHPSSDPSVVAACTIRAAFEYQGQKCSACSRLYVPKSLWGTIKETMLSLHSKLKMGQPDDFKNFMCAVIDERSYKKIISYIDHAREDGSCTILAGGNASAEVGWFIEPTIIETTDIQCRTMTEEIFGPVVTCYVYDDATVSWEEICKAVDGGAVYGLTGSIFAKDRADLGIAAELLRNTAGNLYLNDKSTGAVVGQQPFGGSRSSGTNDKAGSPSFLLRWVSARTVKENFEPQTMVSYPHQLPDVVKA